MIKRPTRDEPLTNDAPSLAQPSAESGATDTPARGGSTGRSHSSQAPTERLSGSVAAGAPASTSPPPRRTASGRPYPANDPIADEA